MSSEIVIIDGAVSVVEMIVCCKSIRRAIDISGLRCLASRHSEARYVVGIIIIMIILVETCGGRNETPGRNPSRLGAWQDQELATN